ncbi:MAG: enoyl-CoA hydratase/isomerase family protein [Cystobacterineae bacterium]|nr:enoyl-CoA hydratase/isomerase family protein [Cystobacterineae bacterium]
MSFEETTQNRQLCEGRVLLEDLGGGVCRLTLSNASQRNALTVSMLDELKKTFASSAQVRAWLIQGEGQQAFCSGYNIETLKHYEEGEQLPDEGVHEALCALEAHPAPSVALVQGFAYGAGLELAAACDFRVSDATGIFCMPPARLGLIYPLGGIRRIANLIGMGRARWMFLTGQRVLAPQALEWGLLNGLVASPEEAHAYARGLCQNLAAGAPLALRGMRASMRYAMEQKEDSQVLQRLREERRKAYNSEDTREGRAAFLEKRPPRFKGF